MICPHCHRCCDCDRARAEFQETLERMRVAMRRRAPEILSVGERRETTLEAEERASSGGAAPTGPLSEPGTGVASTLLRGLDGFVGEDGPARAAEWLASLRLIVSQRREIGPDGQPRRVREVLIMTAEVRNALVSCPPDRREAVIHGLIETHGESSWAAVRPSLDGGGMSIVHWQATRSGAVDDQPEEDGHAQGCISPPSHPQRPGPLT